MRHSRVQMYLLSVMALALAATAAQAQIIETAMRGNTVVAAPGITTAWGLNPAALGGVGDTSAPAVDVKWGGDADHIFSAEFEVSGDSDLIALNWGSVGGDAAVFCPGFFVGGTPRSARNVLSLGHPAQE